MAIATDEHVDTTAQDVTPAPPLTVPDMTSDASVKQFVNALNNRDSKHGVKLLTKLVYKCKRNLDIAHTQLMHITQSVARLNGDTVTLARLTMPRNLRTTARRFYDSLNTASLRMQCQLFDVDYDSYITQEEIIDVLVEKHVELNS